MSDTAELTGLTPDEVTEWASVSDVRLRVLTDALSAAWASLDEGRVKALAEVLAEGIADEARLDLCPLYIAALREIDRAHLEVLTFLLDVRNSPTLDGRRSLVDAALGSNTWNRKELAERLPLLADGLDYLLATLQRVGCVDTSAAPFGGGDNRWLATPFGEGCRGYLRDLPLNRNRDQQPNTLPNQA